MKKIKRAIKHFILKRELKYWRYELESLELALEYCNEVPKEKAQPYLDKVYECWTIIGGLELILKKESEEGDSMTDDCTTVEIPKADASSPKPPVVKE